MLKNKFRELPGQKQEKTGTDFSCLRFKKDLFSRHGAAPVVYGFRELSPYVNAMP
jgi:hypothetical protein